MELKSVYSLVSGFFELTWFVRIIHIVLYSYTFPFSFLQRILLNEYINLLNIWIVFNSSAAVNILLHVFGEHFDTFLLCIYPRTELLDHKIYICSALVDISLYSLTVYESFNCSSCILARTPYFLSFSI